MTEQKIEVKELDIEKILPNTSTYRKKDDKEGGSKTVVIGKAGTGKSNLILSLLYSKKHIFPVGTVLSGTEESNHFYSKVFPSTFIFNGYDESQLNKIIKRQRLAIKHLDNPWAVIILDDCMDDPSVFRKPLQNALYKNGRHWKMWYIVSMQYCLDIPPAIRENTDNVFILRDASLKNRKKLYENYAGIIPDFSLFCSLMDQLTNDYCALYIHNRGNTNDWKECVSFYKPMYPVPKFQFGCEEYWRFHYDRYNPEYVDPIV